MWSHFLFKRYSISDDKLINLFFLRCNALAFFFKDLVYRFIFFTVNNFVFVKYNLLNFLLIRSSSRNPFVYIPNLLTLGLPPWRSTFTTTTLDVDTGFCATPRNNWSFTSYVIKSPAFTYFILFMIKI